MGIFKMSHMKASIIVPIIVGAVTVLALVIAQEPVYGVNGTIQFNNALDPHIFIIYTTLSITVSVALVDLVYWLIKWCQRQDVLAWCHK